MVQIRSLAFATLVCILISGLFSCNPSTEITGSSVTIRLPNEPESLHPIFSKSIYAVQIESLIQLPLAEYDPVSLTLSPLLIIRVPDAELVTEGKHKGGKVFRLEFRKEAVWSDGKPVTGEDYLFTFKSFYNPHYNTNSYRAFADFISEVVVDPADPKKVAVYVDSTYILALEAVTNWNLYPAHLYDTENILSGFSLDQLRQPDTVWTAEQDSLLKKFAVKFESPMYFRENVSGAGAYELDQWVTGEYIRIKRKEKWWGDKVKDPPLLLQAYPTEITYRIILDGAAAEAAMKAGEIDLMAEVPVSDFKSMSTDPEWKDKYQYATPALMQVNYLEMNLRNPVLADVKIRQALAYAVDYDGMLNQVMQGFAKRAVGPIHPDKAYYNQKLQPIKQDINKSIALIQEAGWKDTNGNGTPDKVIDGKLQELKLSLKITNKEEGTLIANIIKENAAKAGFDLEIVIVDPGQIQQDIRQFNYDLTPLRIRAFPSADDPFALWHSSNDKPGGSNRSGIHSAELDEVIEKLRTTEDPKLREEYYHTFQEIMYQLQPSLFLYVPLERIIASKNIELQTSIRRPGYFENLLKPAGS